MPELVEVESYRRLAESVVGRTVEEVVAEDDWYLKRGLTRAAVVSALTGRTITGTRRVGKLLLLDTGRPGVGLGPHAPEEAGVGAPAGTAKPQELPRPGVGLGPHAPEEAGVGAPAGTAKPQEHGPVLGLRFGMAGRLVIDGQPGVEWLLYTPKEILQRWDRFGLRFRGGGDLRMIDPRRLGGVELDPPESRLGPDALSVTPSALDRVLGTSTAPLKARLMDQARLAGVGNLAADEALWRAGLDPARPAGSLSAAERRRLHRHLSQTLADLLAQGGSHTGLLVPHRQPGGLCPKDGTPLVRRTVGGRTTWSCPRHQV